MYCFIKRKIFLLSIDATLATTKCLNVICRTTLFNLQRNIVALQVASICCSYYLDVYRDKHSTNFASIALFLICFFFQGLALSKKLYFVFTRDKLWSEWSIFIERMLSIGKICVFQNDFLFINYCYIMHVFVVIINWLNRFVLFRFLYISFSLIPQRH